MKSTFHSKQLAPFGSLLAALTLIPMAVFADAQVANAGEPQREVVRYDDLNIHSATGRATLLKRIDAAIERICGTSEYPRELHSRGTRECKREARDEALAQIPF